MPMDEGLYRAAQSSDMRVLRKYKGQLTTQLTPYKNTVLHIAAHYTDFSPKEAEEFLAIVGLDLLFCLNSNEDTCIHVAARKGHFDLIEALIRYMKKNCSADRESRIEPVQLLRISNSNGNMALHEAVIHRRHRVVEMLVKEDADFTHPPNKASKSPLFLAMEKKDKVSAELILDNSSSPSYEGPCSTTALHAAALVLYGAYGISHFLPIGAECLEMILGRNPAGCLEKILEKNPKLINQVDDEGWSPLHFAAFLGTSRTVRTLLKKDKRMAYETIKQDNKTPLHLAALNARPFAAKEIIEHCPDSTEAVTSKGHDALRLAWLNRSTRVRTTVDLGQFNILQSVLDHHAEQSSDPGVVIHHPYLDETNLWWRGKEVKNKLAEDKDSWTDRINTHLLVATLIVTIAFAAGFTIPGGYEDDFPNEGTAILSRKTAFQAFVVADTLAMIFSTFAVILHFIASLKRGTMTYYRYMWAAIFITIAMVAMMIAFTTGLYVVLRPSQGLAIAACVMCSVSLFGFMFVFDVEGLLHTTRKHGRALIYY
ncbi:ankyrin repeat-containing protein At5g02620-like [Lycium barbarum]|uniref:ankyrin repeat-containing protein At5g02620-like n=1 Tax=Lycium barbarum TaxID=112863 RepID=UPI00293F3AD7|nr:ankyrin repeat-containing protein At5g02620-like [Lycium barbarum]